MLQQVLEEIVPEDKTRNEVLGVRVVQTPGKPGRPRG